MSQAIIAIANVKRFLYHVFLYWIGREAFKGRERTAPPQSRGRDGLSARARAHLRRWDERNRSELYEVPRRFAEAGVPHDWHASFRITRWAYDQVTRSGGQVWGRGRELEPLPGEWAEVLAT
jgi:hypothetical protein